MSTRMATAGSILSRLAEGQVVRLAYSGLRNQAVINDTCSAARTATRQLIASDSCPRSAEEQLAAALISLGEDPSFADVADAIAMAFEAGRVVERQALEGGTP